MEWRLIEQDTYSAAMNMAIEHAVYESVAKARELPTIRFYKWINDSVSLGAFQHPWDINIDACKKYKVDIVRRMTGGRAVFHDKSDFTYSVIAPIKFFNYSIAGAYSQICSWIINALDELIINSKIENKNDIVVDGKKISGNAAKSMGNGIYLQHGTLVYDINFSIMPKVLNISEELAKSKIASILQYKKIGQSKVYETLKNSFTADKDFKTEKLSKFELMRAENLVRNKYTSITLPENNLLKSRGICYVERRG